MKICCILAALASTSAFASPMWDSDSMWGAPGKDMTLLCSVMEASGGKDNFSTRHALDMALGKDKAQQEYDKLSSQFGEGKVYRFFAVNDTLFKEGLMAANLHYGAQYEPVGWDASTPRDFIRAGMDKDYYSSERQLDRLFGHTLHEQLMKSIEWRYGPEAGHEYHMVMDQLVQDMAPQVGLSNLKISPSNG